MSYKAAAGGKDKALSYGSMGDYVLARGTAGQRRLEILNEALWPYSKKLLRKAGLRRGMSFLDVGCGPGALTARVAALGMDAVGVDIDPGFIDAAKRKYPKVHFACVPVSELESLDRTFDVVYSRYLLSHLDDPGSAIAQMKGVTKPGGRLVLEDIDFDLHISHPRPPAFDRYIELYAEVVRSKGGDPFLGRRLFGLALEASLLDVSVAVQVPMFTGVRPGSPKRMSSLTLGGIRESILAAELTSGEELDYLLEELGSLENDPRSMISTAGTFQVVGIWPGKS